MITAGLEFHSVRYGHEATSAVVEAVARGKGGDPLAPVTVVVPTRMTGVALRRRLVASRGATVGVRFVVLSQLAELLGARRVAARGLTPLTAALRREYLRMALDRTSATLGEAAAHPATERLMGRAVAELRAATATGAEDAVLPQLRRAGRLPSALAATFRSYRSLVRDAHADGHDLALAAAESAAHAPGVLHETGPVILHLPRLVPPSGQRLVRALAGRTGVTVFLARTGDRSADAPAARLQAALGGQPSPSTGIPPLPDRFLRVPDAEEEVRAVLREIAALAAGGLPLDRIAVLYAQPEPYATLTHELFAASGVPHSGPPTRTLAQTAAGRALLGLLDLPEADWSREALVDWLAGTPIHDAQGRLPARLAADVASAALVVRGREQWGRRLRAHLAGLEATDDESRDGATARRLLAFVERLQAGLDGPDRGDWGAQAAWLGRQLDAVLGPPSTQTGWSAEERDAARAVRERVTALADLDQARRRAGSAAPVDRATVRRVLAAELDEPAARVGRLVGVHLGLLGSAPAIDFDHVFLLGMAEGSFPPRPPEQPVLPESLRRRLRERHPPLAAGLPLRQERVEDARAALFAALGAGRASTVLTPRVDRRRQREQHPAPWFLELAGRRAGTGRPLRLAELAGCDAEGWWRSVPSAQAGIAAAAEPASPTEWVARRLLADGPAGHPLIGADAALAAGMAVARERQGGRFSVWDGLVGSHPYLEAHLARPVAPTTLAQYGRCPRAYLLQRVLGLRVVEEPRERLDLDRARRGVLLHDVLHRFLAGPPERRELHRLADAALAEVEEGLAGHPALLRRERERLHADLDRWLDEHLALPATLGVLPVGGEITFGDDESVAATLPGGRTLRFHGRLDRLDASADGTVVLVADYKSGRDDEYRSISQDPVLAGRHFQLPVYALAAAQRYPGADVHARYWFVGSPGAKDPMPGFVLDGRSRVRILDAVDVLAEGIAGGTFPARPGEWDEFRGDYATCRTCAFGRVCAAPGERDRAWERDRADPALHRFTGLVEGPP